MVGKVQTARSQSAQRALKLLGSGCGASVVATACGISESAVSQMLADTEFAKEVSELRFHNLNKHNEHDNILDEMEVTLAASLKEQLPLLMRPADILRALQVVNNMKRRGQSAPEQLLQQNQVVQLLMPVVITQKFTTNVNNQVIIAGNQTLETIQGSVLLNAAKAKQAGLHNEPPTYTRTSELSSSSEGTGSEGSQQGPNPGSERTTINAS